MTKNYQLISIIRTILQTLKEIKIKSLNLWFQNWLLLSFISYCWCIMYIIISRTNFVMNMQLTQRPKIFCFGRGENCIFRPVQLITIWFKNAKNFTKGYCMTTDLAMIAKTNPKESPTSKIQDKFFWFCQLILKIPANITLITQLRHQFYKHQIISNRHEFELYSSK